MRAVHAEIEERVVKKIKALTGPLTLELLENLIVGHEDMLVTRELNLTTPRVCPYFSKDSCAPTE